MTFPLVIRIPTTPLIASSVLVPVHQNMDILWCDGHLRALITGTFVVQVRNFAGDLIDTLEWDEDGLLAHEMEYPYPQLAYQDDGFRIDTSGNLPIGAFDCTVTVWANPA